MLLDGNVGSSLKNHNSMFVFMGSTGELVRTSESTDSVKCGKVAI